MSKISLFGVFLVYVVVQGLVNCAPSSNKSGPRLPRSSNTKTNNEEFEKFFLKASKSVPRIGRRGYVNDNYYNDNGSNGLAQYRSLKYPYPVQTKRKANNFAPFWSEIAQIYEFNPDLPNILDGLSSDEELQGDDPSVYDTNNRMKFKKAKLSNFELNGKENVEYRLQPEVA